ncbi:MAG: sugar transferase [Prevotella sp.]|nr:sugar transferase [Prevotella sp.]
MVLSGFAIIVLSPLLLILCILELIYHGRPIFYIDQRPGLNGRIFGLYKFRSMNNACDENGKLLHPSKRITPFGRVLRRTSLDELAGLFNIFNGTMSIIGPRPLMKDYLPLYSERHKYRHAVRPGLVCLKVGGSDKLTASTWTWNAQFESDIYYVEHVSFALDVWMVLKTIKTLLTKSEMRTDSDRVKFDGNNLLETRPRHEIIAEIEKKAADGKQ